MKEHFTVTVTDFRGARHYSLHQIAKRVALVLLSVLLLTLLGGATTIYFLNDRIADLNEVRAQKEEVARSIEERNRELRELIGDRERELQRLDLELGQIESLVGIEDTAPDMDREERLEMASQTALEKSLMLRSIPSGWPLEDSSVVTSGYGWRIHPVTGERSFHGAVDLRAGHGTEVYATADGVVNFAGKHQGSGLGLLVIVDHDFSFRTHYAHLDEIKVDQGEYIKQGELIGLSGASGNVNGPHLHYEVWHLQRRLDPEPFLEWSLSAYDELFEQEGRVKWDSLAKGIKRRAEALEQQLSAKGPGSSEN